MLLISELQKQSDTVKLKEGDPVSFVNEKLEGRILKELPGNCYRVEIEDGFTLDVTASEIVIRRTFLRSAPVPVTSKPGKTESEEIPVNADKIQEVFQGLEGFYLLVIPERSQVLGGKIGWWIYNGSSNEQLFTVSAVLKKGSEKLLRHGLIASSSAELIQEVSRNDAGFGDELMVRWISCYPDKPVKYSNKILQPELPALEQTNTKLAAPFCFTRYHRLDNNDLSTPGTEDLKDLFAKYNTVPDQKKKSVAPVTVQRDNRRSNEVLKQFGLNPGELEVDLHIEELISDPEKISASDMLDIQLGTFRNALDRALVSRNREITFIHGVGNGRLRAAIRKELSELGYKFSDGPYEKYGAGATFVKLTA